MTMVIPARMGIPAAATGMQVSVKTFYSKMKNGVFGTDEADRMIELLKIEDPATIFLSVR